MLGMRLIHREMKVLLLGQQLLRLVMDKAENLPRKMWEGENLPFWIAMLN
jgi:hypothetical protein